MTTTLAPTRSNALRWVRCVVVLFIHLLLLTMVTLTLARFVPAYITLFDHENLELPAITTQVVSLSQFFVAYWYLVLLVGMIVDLAVMILLTSLAGRVTWPRTLYEHAWLLGTCLVLFWIALCLAMPIEKLATRRA